MGRLYNYTLKYQILTDGGRPALRLQGNYLHRSWLKNLPQYAQHHLSAQVPTSDQGEVLQRVEHLESKLLQNRASSCSQDAGTA